MHKVDRHALESAISATRYDDRALSVLSGLSEERVKSLRARGGSASPSEVEVLADALGVDQLDFTEEKRNGREAGTDAARGR